MYRIRTLMSSTDYFVKNKERKKGSNRRDHPERCPAVDGSSPWWLKDHYQRSILRQYGITSTFRKNLKWDVKVNYSTVFVVLSLSY